MATAERESRENESCGADVRAASKQILFTRLEFHVTLDHKDTLIRDLGNELCHPESLNTDRC